jgi:hypothetical protein
LFSEPNFKSNQTLPITIKPYDYFDLPIEFADTIEGPVTGTLKIFSNDPDENPFTAQLSGNAFIPNYLLVNNQNFLQGESKSVAIEVRNVESFVALQFDLNYPAGFTPDLNAISLTERKQDHVLAAVALSKTGLRILIYSPGQKTFTGNSGPVLNIPFKAEESMIPGYYNLTFSNTLLSNPKSENILYSPENGILNIQKITTEITQETDNKDVKIYPNPATESFHIYGIKGTASLKLIDINGKETLIKEIKNNESVSVSSLPKGLYLIKLIISDHVIERKLIRK